MTAPAKWNTNFRDVFVMNPNRVYIVAGDDRTEKLNIKMSWILAWRDGVWGNVKIPVNSTSVSVVGAPNPGALFMAVDGRVSKWGIKWPIVQEIIDSSSEGPQHVGDLREIRTIGDKAYVVGMGRTAYKRDGLGKWTRIDKGLRAEGDDDVGLNSIDGWSATNLVAVGFNGEIWSFNGRKWTREASPVDRILNKVICAPNKLCVACGQSGIVLRKNGKKWIRVDHDITKDDFWGAAWFKGAIYLSTLDGLFRLKKDRFEKLKIQSPNSKKPIRLSPGVSFFRLHTDGKVLWSVGRRQAMFSENGTHWTETPYK